MHVNENAAKPFRLPSLLSESILLAWIPIAAYFIAFSFEKAYCDKFAVPLYLIDVDTGAIFTCSLYLLFFVLVLGKIATLPLLPLKGKSVMRGLGSYGFAYGVLYLHNFIVQSDNNTNFLLEIAFVLLPWFICDVLYGLTIRKEQPSFWGRLQGFRLLMPNTLKLSEHAAILIEQAYKLAGITFIIWYIASGMGEYAATKTKTYLVSTSDPSLILINVKDDRAICSRFDPKTLKVLHQLVILPIKDDAQTAFERTELGFLSFDK